MLTHVTNTHVRPAVGDKAKAAGEAVKQAAEDVRTAMQDTAAGGRQVRHLSTEE